MNLLTLSLFSMLFASTLFVAFLFAEKCQNTQRAAKRTRTAAVISIAIYFANAVGFFAFIISQGATS